MKKSILSQLTNIGFWMLFKRYKLRRLYQRRRPQASFVFADLLFNSEIAQQSEGRLPTECDAAGCSVDEH
jgi:hypothetical protein